MTELVQFIFWWILALLVCGVTAGLLLAIILGAFFSWRDGREQARLRQTCLSCGSRRTSIERCLGMPGGSIVFHRVCRVCHADWKAEGEDDSPPLNETAWRVVRGSAK